MDARWQEVWHRHENKSRNAVARELAARIFFFTIGRQRGVFFSPLSGIGYSGSGGPCCQLWHAASEPCQCPHVHLPK